MNAKSSIIQVENLTVKYDNDIILNKITFDITPGEIFVIIGPSGCGKTTLMNHMIGLQKPLSGNVFIDGNNIITASEKQRINILNEIGVMYQSGALFGSMNLLENVRLPLEEFSNLPLEAMNTIAYDKLALVGLDDYYNYMPAEISGGMQKRAAIARAMALDPKILFLDEPSAGLDPITSAHLDELILDLSQTLGSTFVIVSHELPSIYYIAERVIMLNDGEIIASGKPETLRDHCDNVLVKEFFHRGLIENHQTPEDKRETN
jgi:phospholipid/cholesterol/gamma-HCH transport system ATP-binding protein